MSESNETKFDFDRWSKLAAEDPASFESLRQAAIEDVINQASPEHQARLRSLQWRIDQERRQAKTPLAACIRISRMMWERLVGDGGLLEHLKAFEQSAYPVQQPVPVQARARSAKVVPFSR